MAEIRIADALEHQEACDRSNARFKLVRAGRRWGKTTWAFKAAMVGHGMPDAAGVFPLQGVFHGKQVYWIPPDYKQAGTLWHAEVVPRLGGVAGIKLNNTEHDAWFPNGGALLMRSAENIGAVRGAGKLLGGVILEEAGHWALEEGWKNELRPTLMDNQGWAVFIGTTNRGNDGSRDDENNLVLPSFFNRLCQRQQQGLLGEDWAQFHGTALQNPKIARVEFEKLAGEYDQGSVAYRQEMLAELLASVEGVVFKEWRADLHVLLQDFTVPSHWVWGAGLDFGYRKPGAFVLFACGPDGDVVAVDEVYFRELHAEEAGFRCGVLLARYPFGNAGIAYDEAMKQNTGLGVTQAEQFATGLRRALGSRAPWMYPQSHGPGSRAAGLQLFHRYLAWQEGEHGEIPPWGQPRLKLTTRCANGIRTLPTLPYSPSRAIGEGEDVDCFVAGTMVGTIVGPQAIESLVVGDVVHTPVGARRVTHAYLSGTSATVRVHLANGTTLEGTPHHRVFVEGMGLIPLRDLFPGLTLTAKTIPFPTWERSSSTTEPAITDPPVNCTTILTVADSPRGQQASIGKSGWTTTALFRPAAVSTTGITIPTITDLRIWNWWKQQHMPPIISTSDWHAVLSVNNWLNGEPANPAGGRFAPTLEKCLRDDLSENWRALIVESLLPPGIRAMYTAHGNVLRSPRWLRIAASVRSAVARFHGRKHAPDPPALAVTSVVGCSARKPVYNITVEQAHLFYANGVLCTNTNAEDHFFDATKYFLMSRPPIAPRLPIEYASAEDADTARRWAERIKRLAASGAEVEPRRPWEPKRMVRA